MNLSKKNLPFAFFSTLFFTLFTPAITPSLRLMFFVPFLVILFYQKTFSVSLWMAFFCGLIIDLLSIQSPFGFYALNYTLTAAIIFPQKRNFFADHLSTLPIMTLLFSSLATLLQAIFLYIFSSYIHINLWWVFTDLIIMPLFDGLYAFIWFILVPMILPKKSRRRSY